MNRESTSKSFLSGRLILKRRFAFYIAQVQKVHSGHKDRQDLSHSLDCVRFRNRIATPNAIFNGSRTIEGPLSGTPSCLLVSRGCPKSPAPLQLDSWNRRDERECLKLEPEPARLLRKEAEGRGWTFGTPCGAGASPGFGFGGFQSKCSVDLFPLYRRRRSQKIS